MNKESDLDILLRWGMYPCHADKLLSGDEYWIKSMLKEFDDTDVEPGEPYPAREIVLKIAKQYNIVI